MNHFASPPGRFGLRPRAAHVASVALACLSLLGTHRAAAGFPGVDVLTSRVSRLSPFLPDCNGTSQTGILYANSEVEPFVASNPMNPLNLVGTWQQDRWSDGGSQGLGTAYSFDAGITWHRLYQPFTRCAGGNAENGGDFERGSDPWVSFSPNGVVHEMVLALSFNAEADEPVTAMLASRSLDGGVTWGPTSTLQADTAEYFNDKNSITADPTDANYVYATWDRLSSIPGEGAGPTVVARSVDNGATWEAMRIAYDPGPTAQTIGNRIEVLPDGTLVDLFTLLDFDAQTATLQVIRSTDKGATWSGPVFVADVLSIGAFDPETGKPIRDGSGLAQMSISRDGRISVVWQDARFSGGARDGIALSESTDGGATWSAPVQINHDPLVQAFTPSVRVRDDGTVGVSYYDLRNNTADATTLPTDYWLTRSGDRMTWREHRITATFDLDSAPFAGGLFLGDYQGIVSIGPIFIPFFVKTNHGTTNADDVFSHIGLPRHQGMDAPLGSAELERQVARDEATLPVMSVQGRGSTMAEASPAMRAATWRAFERLLRARVPDWDARLAARHAAP
jgi:hypothetical protein